MAVIVLAAPGAPSWAQGLGLEAGLCRAAGSEAEIRLGLPTGLLTAIGRVESGRIDPATGTVVAWPWTINANGAGRMFASGPAAVAGTRAAQEEGVNSIDVGCFQINLLHHPAAFSSLEQAFDPASNANYAAHFLSSLFQRLGSWEAAVAAYHSSTSERGLPYRDRVLAAWGGVREPAPAPPPVMMPFRINTVAWTPASGTAVRVWTPSAAGAAAHVITISQLRQGR